MKSPLSLLSTLFLPLLLISCSSSKEGDGGEVPVVEPQTGFRASGGTERGDPDDPFWLLDVDYEKSEIQLAVTGDAGFERKMPMPEPLQRPDLDLVIYRQTVGGETMEVSLFRRPCTNHAGTKQSYQAKVQFLDASGQANGRSYTGCGQFNGLGELTRLWQLTEIDGVEVSSVDETEGAPTIEFPFNKNGVRGSGSCNRFSGEVTIGEGSTITIGNLISTKMACPQLDRETEYLGILSNTTHTVTVKGEEMMLASPKGVLTFRMK